MMRLENTHFATSASRLANNPPNNACLTDTFVLGIKQNAVVSIPQLKITGNAHRVIGESETSDIKGRLRI